MSEIKPMDGALALVPFDAPEPFGIVSGEDVATLLARLLDQGRLLPDQIPFLTIWLNGEELSRDDALDWELVDGDQVALVLVPQGGGEGKKDVGQILLNLAILVVSVMTGQIEAAVFAGINLTRALFARASDKSKGANESYALGGQSNNVRLDQPMPLILGLQTVYPDVAAQPYTQTVGDTVYLHVVYGLHYGPCAVSDIKIGGTELTQYGADVETQVITASGSKSSPLYPSRVVQNGLSDTLDEAGNWEVATSALDADSLEVDLVWPSGLYRMSSSQVQKSLAITITIERRMVGSASWLSWVNETLDMNTKDAVRRTWATSVTKGQYEVRLRRSVPPPANSGAIIDTVVWTALRTVENTAPVSDPNLSLLFCRFKASKELSGTLPLVSALVEPIAEVWTGSAWGSPQATSNPAALVRMLAMGPNAALPIAASEVGASLAAFFTHCATNDFKAGLQVLGDASLGDAMQATAACGHGAIWHDGSQLQCALEWTKPAPKALFDWRTASNWREERDWLGEIHGMRVAYRDATNNGAAGEVLVYADGYSSANASLFERVDVDRSMSPARAWREGRKALVRRINGGRSISFRTPADGLDVSAVQFGARVAIVPPLLSLARASAGVEHRLMAGGLVAGVRLDDDVEIVTGITHGLRIGTPLRGVLAVQVAAAGGAIGWTRDLYFTSPMAPNDAPEAGDKVVFGQLGSEAQDYEIASLRPLSNFDVEVTATPYLGPLIAAVEGEIPPAGLQGALNTANSPLAAPRIDAATPNGEGGVLVLFALLPQRGNPIDAITVRRRVQLVADGTDAVSWGQWEDLPSLSGSARMVTIPPPNMAAGGLSAQNRALAMEIQLAAVSRAATSLPTTATVSLTRQLVPEVAATVAPHPVNMIPGSGPLILPGNNTIGWLGDVGSRWEIVESNQAYLGLAMWKYSLLGLSWDELLSPIITVAAGDVLSAGGYFGRFGAWSSGDVGYAVLFLDSAGEIIGSPTVIGWALDGVDLGNGVYEITRNNFVAPAGAVSARFSIGVANGAGTGYAAAWRFKMNRGATFATWSDEATTAWMWQAKIGANVILPDGTVATEQDLLNRYAPRVEGPRTTTIQASFTGEVLSGELPRILTIKRYLGPADVSASTTWSHVATGSTATVTDGVVTITGCTVSGSIIVTALRDGLPITHEIEVLKNLAAPPVTGGGGATVAVDTTIDPTSSTTLVTCGGPITVRAGAAGTINFAAYLSFTTNATVGKTWAAGRIRYRVGAGAWSWAGAESTTIVDARGYPEPEVGEIDCGVTVTGLAAGTDYECELQLRRSLGAGTLSFIGSFAAEAS